MRKTHTARSSGKIGKKWRELTMWSQNTMNNPTFKETVSFLTRYNKAMSNQVNDQLQESIFNKVHELRPDLSEMEAEALCHDVWMSLLEGARLGQVDKFIEVWGRRGEEIY